MALPRVACQRRDEIADEIHFAGHIREWLGGEVRANHRDVARPSVYRQALTGPVLSDTKPRPITSALNMLPPANDEH
jgi:hypothetical protein